MRKIKWKSGDNFLVPLKDGTFGHGQVLSYEAQAMNSAICALSSSRFIDFQKHVDGISEKDLIAVQFVTRESLDNGYWPLINNKPTLRWENLVDIHTRKNKGFVGTKIIGSAIATNFLNAYHRLVPWDDYHDPNYLDKLLISSDRKPANVLLKSFG